ncbi:hypothetical protein J6590_037783 [Homalodisca vitripennis]|nr:hypothetical protein J6590_037783 [Homalodisca vitripennis]
MYKPTPKHQPHPTNFTEKSKIAHHCWSEDHHMNWDEAHIIHREPHFFKRKLIEATYIKLADQPISQPSSQYGFKKFISHEPIITKGPIPVPLPWNFRHLVLAGRHDYHWLPSATQEPCNFSLLVLYRLPVLFLQRSPQSGEQKITRSYDRTERRLWYHGFFFWDRQLVVVVELDDVFDVRLDARDPVFLSLQHLLVKACIDSLSLTFKFIQKMKAGWLKARSFTHQKIVVVSRPPFTQLMEYFMALLSRAGEFPCCRLLRDRADQYIPSSTVT